MPRSRKKKQAFRKANTGFIPMSNSNPSSNINHATCKRCNRDLGERYFKHGHLCHICLRFERKNRNDQFLKRGGIQQPNNHNHDIQSNIINFRRESYLLAHQNSTPEEAWVRRVHSTQPHMLNDYNNHNIRLENFHSSNQNYAAIQFPSGYNPIDFSSPSFDQDQHAHYPSSVETYSPSMQYPPQRLKRKRDSESSSSKKFRPTSYDILPSDNHFSPSCHQQFSVKETYSEPVFDTHEGYQRQQELESLSIRPLSPSISSFDASDKFIQLSENIWKYFTENSQTDEIYEAKMKLRARIQRIIQTKFKSDLFVFGSSMTGFATKTSDVDMCLMFHDQKIQRTRILRILWTLRHLFGDHDFNRLQVIPAKVPIVKFHDSAT